jgi:hypothetical protein
MILMWKEVFTIERGTMKSFIVIAVGIFHALYLTHFRPVGEVIAVDAVLAALTIIAFNKLTK